MSLTRHATTRAAQRGVADEAIALVFAYGDIEYSAAYGRRRLRLSHRRAAELLADDLPFRLVEQAQKVELIVGEADQIVTVLRCDPHPARRSPRSYRRRCTVRV